MTISRIREPAAEHESYNSAIEHNRVLSNIDDAARVFEDKR